MKYISIDFEYQTIFSNGTNNAKTVLCRYCGTKLPAGKAFTKYIVQRRATRRLTVLMCAACARREIEKYWHDFSRLSKPDADMHLVPAEYGSETLTPAEAAEEFDLVVSARERVVV